MPGPFEVLKTLNAYWSRWSSWGCSAPYTIKPYVNHNIIMTSSSHSAKWCQGKNNKLCLVATPLQHSLNLASTSNAALFFLYGYLLYFIQVLIVGIIPPIKKKKICSEYIVWIFCSFLSFLDCSFVIHVVWFSFTIMVPILSFIYILEIFTLQNDLLYNFSDCRARCLNGSTWITAGHRVIYVQKKGCVKTHLLLKKKIRFSRFSLCCLLI